MANSAVFQNISPKRIAAMKVIMRRRILAYARKNQYEISTWIVPATPRALWHIVLKSKKMRPKLDFLARVNYDAGTQRLSIELLRKPSFVSYSSALAQLQSVYRASRA